MRNKIISAICAVAISMVSFSVTYAAEGKEITDQPLSKEMKVMTVFDLMGSIDCTDPQAAVSRGQFVSAVMDLMALIPAHQYSSYFKDVDEQCSDALSIVSAAEYGIVNGSDGFFYPNKQITYVEAVTMLINALGYYDIVGNDYPNGYLRLANDIGLKNKITATAETLLNSDMAAKLLYNAGNANMLSLNFGKSTISQSNTLFWEKHKIDFGKGVVFGNEFTTLESEVGVGKDEIRIDDFVGNIYFNNDSVNLLGCNVEYFYKYENETNVVYYIEALDNKNDIVTIYSDNIEEFDIDNMTIYYENAGKQSKETIYKDTSVIYNGKLTIDYFYTENGATKSIFDIENGYIKIIENDGDGKCDVVNIIDYENYFVSGVNSEEQTVYDLYDKNKSFSYEDIESSNNSWILTDREGNIVDFSEIKENDVLSIAKSQDGSLMRGVICKDSVYGNITGIENDGEYVILKVDAKEYILNDSFFKKITIPSLGTKATIYLDYTGKVAGIKAETATEGYAFVIKKQYHDDIENYALKLLTSDGKIERYMLADSVRVDGRRYKESELFGKMATFDDYQVVRYSMNSEKELVMIDTIEADNKGDFDDLYAMQNNTINEGFWYTQQNFGGKMLVDKNTVAFKTPKNDDNVKYDDSLYSVVDLSLLDGKYVDVRGFKRDNDKLAVDCVQIVSGGNKTSFGMSSPTMIVKKIYTALNAEDEVTYAIEGYQTNGSEVKYTISTSYKYDPSDDLNHNPSDIEPGDIVKYVLDGKNEICYIAVVKKNNTPGLFGKYKTTPSYTGYFTEINFCVYGGYLYSRDGNYIAIKKEKSDLAASTIPEVYLMIGEGTKIVHVTDRERPSISMFDSKALDVLTDYKHHHQEKEVVAVLSNRQIRMLVIYE